jgi:hypothetical protein
MIFKLGDSTLTGTVSTNVLTLSYDTSGYADTDDLTVIYDLPTNVISKEVDLTMLNPTTTAYSLGDAIGANFIISNVSKFYTGSSILQSIELIETIPSGAYRNQAVTATSASPCVFTLNGHTLVNGNRIRLGGTTLPAGFLTGVDYYVVNALANTFQLSTSIGGTAVNSTSTGTAVTITQYPAQLSTYAYITNATLGVVNDNDAFFPTEAQSQTKIACVPLNADPLIFDYKECNQNARNLGIPFASVAGSNLYGLFVFGGTTGQALAAGTKFRARVNILIQ